MYLKHISVPAALSSVITSLLEGVGSACRSHCFLFKNYWRAPLYIFTCKIIDNLCARKLLTPE